MNTPTRTMATLAAAACFGQVHATDHYVSATLTNVQIQVIDLAPNDGQAAGFTVLPTSRTVLESALNVEPAQPFLLDHYESNSFVPHGTVASYGASFAKFSRSGPYGELAAEARGYSTFVSKNFVSALGADRLDLLVAPFTQLVFSGDYRLERTLSDDVPTELTSLSSFNIDLEDRWGIEGRFYDRLQRPFGPTDNLHAVKEGSFSLEYNTYTGETMDVIFSAITSVSAPVPEPAGWAMLLAGLGFLGLPARAKLQGQRRKASFSV